MDFLAELETETAYLEKVYKALRDTMVMLPEELRPLEKKIKENRKIMGYIDND